MISASSFCRIAGRRVLTTTNSRHLCTLLHPTRSSTARLTTATNNTTPPASTAAARAWYTTTPTLFRKFESHHDHANIHNSKSAPASAASTSASGSQEQEDDGEIPSKDNDKTLLTDTDDLMVGSEGLETIDPKDFPELYPQEHEIQGLSQESHPDNERDFEGFTMSEEEEVMVVVEEEGRRSVLLSDKPRSEDEFSWFVDESYPDKASSTTAGQDEEAFIPLWQKNAQRSSSSAEGNASASGAPTEQQEYTTPDSIPGLVKLLESERARNIKVIDMRDKCDWTNWMVIAEGLSERHLGNVADEVYSAVSFVPFAFCFCYVCLWWFFSACVESVLGNADPDLFIFLCIFFHRYAEIKKRGASFIHMVRDMISNLSLLHFFFFFLKNPSPQLKKTSPATSPPVMEGRDTSADWVVIDAGSVVIHFMTPEARKERDLEGLWASVKNPLKMKDVEELSWDDVKGKMIKGWKEDHGRSRGEDGKRGRRGERDIPLSDVVKW
jgi:ribosomal silencing factor RsfS